MPKSFIKVKYQIEGVHRWKTCPFPEVFYLKNYHRHIFFFEVEMSVTALDREVEFIRLKNELVRLGDDMLKEPVDMSCEMMALTVFNYLTDVYGSDHHYKITVYEDNENGGGVESD